MKKHLANLVTIVGLLACTFLLWPILAHPDWLWFMLALSAVVVASDRYDGYFARKFNAVSSFGASMDRWRDKFFVFEMCYFLLASNSVSIAIKIPVGLVVLTEVALLIMLAFENAYRVNAASNWWGKRKMFAECVAIGMCLLSLIANEYTDSHSILSVSLAAVLFLIAVPFAVGSFVGHIAQFRFQRLRKRSRQRRAIFGIFRIAKKFARDVDRVT